MSDMDGYLDPTCRQCGEDTCVCLRDDDAPQMCAHGRDMGDGCACCAAEAELQLAGAFARMLQKIQAREDETLGAALAARFGG